jgi:hypothetical protein
MKALVNHTTGTLLLEDSELVSQMNGTSGFFKKTPWSKEDRIPTSSIRFVNIQQDGQYVSLAISHSNNIPVAYLRCQPLDEIEKLIEEIVEQNSSVLINEVDVKEEREKLRAQAPSRYDNEVIGVDRHVTLTRLVLGGVVGGLLFKKKKVLRRKDFK